MTVRETLDSDRSGRPATAGRPISPRAAMGLAGFAGLMSAAAVLAAAELVALVVSAQASPLFAVGAWVVDLTPGWLKEAVIQVFGSGDKAFLLAMLGLLVAILAVACGILQLVRAPFGLVLLLVVCAVAGVAVLTRPHSSAIFVAPTIVGAIVGGILLVVSVRRLADWGRGAASTSTRVPSTDPDGQIARRSFLRLVIVSSAAAVVVGTGARLVNAGSAAVTAAREKLKLPAPATPADPVPSGARLDVEGITPFVTDNSDFYRVDTALQVPRIDPADWRLKVTGMVDKQIEIDFAHLLSLPLTEHMLTLACVSNPVGGDLIGNADWLGYPIRELLAEARPHPDADMVLSRSQDGFTAGTPLDVLQDERTAALLAVGMNGKPLPIEHGFPVRMVVPGLYGYVSATKWVVELKVTRFADESAYWTDQGWAPKGPIKTQSRIDVPRAGAIVAPGQVTVAGVAWAQHTGIRRVEVRVDDGPWADAMLAESASKDTWRQWSWPWQADAGDHTLAVRATDDSGYTQTKALAPPAPDGATGWHSIDVHVG